MAEIRVRILQTHTGPACGKQYLSIEKGGNLLGYIQPVNLEFFKLTTTKSYIVQHLSKNNYRTTIHSTLYQAFIALGVSEEELNKTLLPNNFSEERWDHN